jgi:hypothetical protein
MPFIQGVIVKAIAGLTVYFCWSMMEEKPLTEEQTMEIVMYLPAIGSVD